MLNQAQEARERWWARLTPDEQARYHAVGPRKFFAERWWARQMEYSREESAPPELKRFQQIFGRYFPVILDPKNGERAAIALYRPLKHAILYRPKRGESSSMVMDTIDHSTIDRDLKRLKKAIKTIVEHPVGYFSRMKKMFFENDAQYHNANIVRRCVIDMMRRTESCDIAKALNDYERWARKAIERTPNRRNINWEGVHAIAALREFWTHGTFGRVAPRRALKLESPFASYLRDAFKFFEIKGDPISAFRRWAILTDKDRQFVR